MSEAGDGMQDLANQYTRLFLAHGDSPQASQWSSRETQDKRLRELIRVIEPHHPSFLVASILDFGCGTGRLLDLLQNEFAFSGIFTGVDISAPIIDFANTLHPESRFLCTNLLEEPLVGKFDYVLCSGTFNNREMETRLWDALPILFAHCKTALAFNLLSTFVDYQDEGLSYFDPTEVLRFCKAELSPYVVLAHDYELKKGVVPFEFTVSVSRKPRG